MALFSCVILLETLFISSLVSLDARASSQRGLPSAHIITSVPWHQQLNGLSCGAAALETVFDYWGPDIDQKEVMNVARTSSAGTWTADIVRAGHFSYLSDAEGSYFPSVGPDGGFKERKLGYASFSHTSVEPWIDKLKALIANDMPVLVLMKYYPWGGGGHYRVVIGYDDTKQIVYFMDPWGRDLNHLTDWTGMTSWSYSYFLSGWNYSEDAAANPYFGAVVTPWRISLNIKGKATKGSVISVTASVEYPCPEPFNNDYPANNAMMNVSLPEGTVVINNSQVPLGTMSCGETATFTWKILCNENVSGKSLRVAAWGVVSEYVPEAYWMGAPYYPAYSYSDAIGAEATTTI